MTSRMAGPDCAVVMCNLINTHAHTQFFLSKSGFIIFHERAVTINTSDNNGR